MIEGAVILRYTIFNCMKSKDAQEILNCCILIDEVTAVTGNLSLMLLLVNKY